MSFGFSIGDFIAVGQLAQSLYRDIYKVARHAPEEVQILGKELAIFSQSIGLLNAEAQDDESILKQAGDDRVALTNNIVSEAEVTLRALEKLLCKHELRGDQKKVRGKLRVAWDRFRFALDFASINQLRGKLQYHNGVINLLLTSVNGSSLQRVEQSNLKMHDDIVYIRKLLAAQSLGDASDAPVLSLIDSDSSAFSISLSATFLEKAEFFQPWMSSSFEKWVQVGKWWLLKAQKHLSSLDSSAETLPTQACADLMKSAWILIDILPKHPHAKFWSESDSYSNILSLGEMVKSELQVVSARKLKFPTLAEIEMADLDIWSEGTPSLGLHPGAPKDLTEGTNFWQIGSHFVLGSEFGTYLPSAQAGRVDCLLLVLVDAQCQSVKVVGKNQKEEDIFSFHVEPNSFGSRQRWINLSGSNVVRPSFFNHPFRLFDYGPDSAPMNGEYQIDFEFGGGFLFDNVADQLLFECTMESVLFYILSYSKRHAKQLLGILLIRISEISSIIGTERARRATRQLMAVGSHVPDEAEIKQSELWAVAQRIAQRITKQDHLGSGEIFQSSPTLGQPTSTDESILESPVLAFFSRLLNTIAVQAGGDAVRVSLETLRYLEDLTGSARNLYFYAMLSNHVRIVSLVLQFSTDIDINATFTAFGRYQIHNTALRVGGPYYSHGHMFSNHPQPKDLTSLHFVAISGQVDVLEILLAHPSIDINKKAYGHSPISGQSHVGYTPLSYAAYFKNLPVISGLLNAGADVTGSQTPADQGNQYAPIHHAVMSNDAAIVQMLIRSGADLNLGGERNFTPLFFARDDAMRKLLRDAGALPRMRADNSIRLLEDA